MAVRPEQTGQRIQKKAPPNIPVFIFSYSLYGGQIGCQGRWGEVSEIFASSSLSCAKLCCKFIHAHKRDRLRARRVSHSIDYFPRKYKETLLVQSPFSRLYLAVRVLTCLELVCVAIHDQIRQQ